MPARTAIQQACQHIKQAIAELTQDCDLAGDARARDLHELLRVLNDLHHVLLRFDPEGEFVPAKSKAPMH